MVRKEEHECLHERDWGTMHARMESMHDKVEQIHKLLLGNGSPSLQTQIEKAKANTTVQWYFIGAILLAIIGAFVEHVAK